MVFCSFISFKSVLLHLVIYFVRYYMWIILKFKHSGHGNNCRTPVLRYLDEMCHKISANKYCSNLLRITFSYLNMLIIFEYLTTKFVFCVNIVYFPHNSTHHFRFFFLNSDVDLHAKGDNLQNRGVLQP